MGIIEQIKKAKKIKGFTWDKLSEGLPISGNALAVAFNRNSVDKTYLEFICEKLDIDYSNEINVSKEPDSSYDHKKGVSLLEIRDDIKADLLDIKKNSAKKQHIQALSDSLAENFESITGALLKILQHNEKVEDFIDQIDLKALKEATKSLNK